MLSRKLMSGTPCKLALITSISCGYHRKMYGRLSAMKVCRSVTACLRLVRSVSVWTLVNRSSSLGSLYGDVEALAGGAGVEVRKHVRIVRIDPPVHRRGVIPGHDHFLDVRVPLH